MIQNLPFIARIVFAAVVVIVGIVMLGKSDKSWQRSLAALATIVVALFALNGGSIKITPTSIEAKADEFSKLTQKIGADDKPASLDALADEYQAGIRVWWTLLQYRIELRSELRSLCKAAHLPLRGSETSFSEMLAELKSAGVLSFELSQTLEKIRDATYYSEWREGPPPDLEGIKFVANKTPDALSQLAAIRKKTASTPTARAE
jgi:hypothetical protein